MKRVLKKLMIVIFVILAFNLFCTLNFSNATGFFKAAGYVADDVFEVFAGILGGVISFFTWPLRLFALFAGFLMKEFTNLIALCEGTTEGVTISGTITPFDIFFNNIKLLDINFFDIGTEANFINSMRNSIAGWYYVMRIFASAILLVILIYVGIRMAISTVASDKAMYKKMLFDWVSSLALIFVIQYIVIFTITANNAIVNSLKGMMTTPAIDIEATYKYIFNIATDIIDLNSIAATIIYCMLVWQTLGLVFSYFSRMLKLAFLIIISPLITLTYSIDKMGDGKAQALNTWLKEFVFTVLIQPFHCVIYACMIDMAFSLLNQGGDATQKLARSIIAILMVRFVKEGEKIVRKIFAFKDDDSKTSIAAGMAASAVALNQAKNIGKNTRKAVNSAKNFGKTVANLGRNAKVEALALSAMISNKDGESKTFKERKEEIRTDLNNKRADKIINRSSAMQSLFNDKAVYRVAKESSLQERAKGIMANDPNMSKEQAMKQAKHEQFDKDVKKEKEEIMAASNGTISEKEAESMARLKVAKQNTIRGKAIKGVKTRIRKFNEEHGISDSQVLKEIGDFMKASAIGGFGVMVGSGVYGTSGNLVSAIGAGAATFKGTQEFFSSSGKTISNGITSNLRKMGIKDAEGARIALTEISQNSDKYKSAGVGDPTTKAGQALDKALGDLKNKLTKNQLNEFRTNVSNILEASPLTATDGIQDEFEKLKNGTGVYAIRSGDEIPKDKLEDADLSSLMDFSNKVSIQYQLKQTEDIGMDQTTVINEIVGDFTTASDGKYEEIMGINKERSGAKTIEDFEDKDAEIAAKLEKMADKHIDELIKKYDDKIKESSGEETKSLKLEQAIIIGRALASSSRRLDQKNQNLYNKYQKELKKVADELQEDINKQDKIIEENRKKENEAKERLVLYESDSTKISNIEEYNDLQEKFEDAKKERMQSSVDLQIKQKQKEQIDGLNTLVDQLYGSANTEPQSDN